MQKEQQDATERLRTVENEKDFYKAQANDAMQDLDKGEHYNNSLLKHSIILFLFSFLTLIILPS